MTIVFVTRGYPSINHPQNGNFEATQALALAKLGHKVIIVGVNCYSVKNYDILGFHHRVEDGIEIFEKYNLAIPSHNKMPISWKSKIISRDVKKILDLIIKKHGKPDIIHSHYLLMTSAVSRIINCYNVPFVCTEHWSVLNFLDLPPKIKKLGLIGYKIPDKILAVSNRTAFSISNNFQREVEVLPNMVNDMFFKSNEYAPSKERFIFVTIGQMNTKIKGMDITIRGFAKHKKYKPDSDLIVIGKGKHREEYKSLAKELGVESNISFISELSHVEISKIIERSNVVVMGSRSETFGVTLIEGMAKGKPVIATRCGGPEDFITPEMGILIPVEDIEAMADAMDYVRDNYLRYNQKRIQELCYTNYSENTIANRLIGIYESVIKTSGRDIKG